MPRFVLFLRGEPDSKTAITSLSPEEMQRVVGQYHAWIGSLASKLVMGARLQDEGGKRIAPKREGLVVRDGPYIEAKDALGGLFIIEAASYEEAITLAKGCPHLEFGEIEVREVDPVRNGPPAH